jgi:hypothetical protein
VVQDSTLTGALFETCTPWVKSLAGNIREVRRGGKAWARKKYRQDQIWRQTVDSRQQMADSKQQTAADGRQQIADTRQQIVDSRV